MSLKLSGYVLSYKQLSSLLTRTEGSLDPDSSNNNTSNNSSAEILTAWGPVIWLNRLLEKEGMNQKLQAVPVYDPNAAEDPGDCKQGILLVRGCTLEEQQAEQGVQNTPREAAGEEQGVHVWVKEKIYGGDEVKWVTVVNPYMDDA